jgi:hypothetical protein
MSVAAAIHSYVEMASPIANPDPDIPIKCSAEILDAISDAPIAHHVSEPSARKKSVDFEDALLFLLKT